MIGVPTQSSIWDNQSAAFMKNPAPTFPLSNKGCDIWDEIGVPRSGFFMMYGD